MVDAHSRIEIGAKAPIEALAHIRVFKEPLRSQTSQAEIYLRAGGENRGDTFHTFSLREGILHLLSIEGMRLTIKEFPTGGHTIDDPEFAIRVYRFDRELGTNIVAPMIELARKADNIMWKTDFQLTGVDTRPKGTFSEHSLQSILGISEGKAVSAQIADHEIILDDPFLNERDKPVTQIGRYDSDKFFDEKAPTTELYVEITASTGERYYTASLAEGILHLISANGKRIRVSEVSAVDNSTYAVVVERDGNVLRAKLEAPMLAPAGIVDNKIEWKSEYTPVSPMGDTLADEFFRSQETKQPKSDIEIMEIRLVPF